MNTGTYCGGLDLGSDNMAKEIDMYMLPMIYPVLKEIEGDGIYWDVSFGNKKEERDYILNYYSKLGDSFDEKYDKIKNKMSDPKDSKSPFFWDCPEIKFIVKGE